jgi:hypothetical protein
LDDTELIDILATIKLKSKEVNEKLLEAKDKKIQINEERESRPSGIPRISQANRIIKFQGLNCN